jgi:hypothetical protein
MGATLPEEVTVRSLVVPALAASIVLAVAGPAAPAVAPRTCRGDAVAFSEALKPVIEAVTDGRPDKVPRAAAGAQAWWSSNRSRFARPASIDSAMQVLHALATTHRAPLAASAAIAAANAALDACPEPPSVVERLMRIDLTGMAGWLRAHGVNARFPREAERETKVIVERLRASGHAALADRLASEVAATLAIPVRVNGDVRTANALLQRVDEVEQIVH